MPFVKRAGLEPATKRLPSLEELSVPTTGEKYKNSFALPTELPLHFFNCICIHRYICQQGIIGFEPMSFYKLGCTTYGILCLYKQLSQIVKRLSARPYSHSQFCTLTNSLKSMYIRL